MNSALLRNYLVSALRNLARNKLFSAINIIGLAIGFAAAILIGLYVRDEFSYDRWIPGYDKVFHLTEIFTAPDVAPRAIDVTLPGLAQLMRNDFSEIAAIARFVGDNVSIRRGEIENNENILWADPDFFAVMPLPAIAGDPAKALAEPDGIVLTRELARKYFGRDDPIGETLEVTRGRYPIEDTVGPIRPVPMRVLAVLEDLPPNTHLAVTMIGSGRAAPSFLAFIDRTKQLADNDIVQTYFRLRPNASAAGIKSALPDFVRRHMPPNALDPRARFELVVTPIADIHLTPVGLGPMTTRPSGDPATLLGLALVAALIIFIAAINFVSLMTARAAQRSLEVGVRKTAGAARHNLIAQFLGESLLCVFLAMLAAMALVELLIPYFNSFMNTATTFLYWRDPREAAAVFVLVVLVGLLGGVYPAFVLSAFRPGHALKTAVGSPLGAGAVRTGLVVLQFAVLIGVLITTLTVYRQTEFALHEGMRLDTDQVLIIRGGCRDAFRQEAQKLPGVLGTACADGTAMNENFMDVSVHLPDGKTATTRESHVDHDFFAFYGLRPLAGRFFSRTFGADAIARGAPENAISSVVIDETARQKFGFSSPAASIGQKIAWSRRVMNGDQIEISDAAIIGVVPDFSFASIRTKIEPHIFFIDENVLQILNLKLDGNRLPETLAAIDRLWRQSGSTRPITRTFLDQTIERMYRDISRQSVVFAGFSGLALLVACIGLFALATFAAERRTKEIGIRKSMGATSGEILRLLVWEFAKPVLWANLIAWPVAYFAMSHWLDGFAYHIELDIWLFLAAGAAALGIALATVFIQSLLTARAKPVTALRYE